MPMLVDIMIYFFALEQRDKIRKIHFLDLIFYFKYFFKIKNIVKLVYNDHPRGPKFLAVVDRWIVVHR
jgi:hypothetical protein